MPRARRNEAERALPSSSHQCLIASRRRKRRVEGTSQPLDVSELVDPSVSTFLNLRIPGILIPPNLKIQGIVLSDRLQVFQLLILVW